MGGVVTQNENQVIIYTKDLEEYDEAGGKTDTNDVSSLMFTCSW